MTDATIEDRVSDLERRVHGLEGRSRAKPPKALEWALRPSVAQRIRPEVEERARRDAKGLVVLPGPPLLEDAAREAGGWDALLRRLEDGKTVA